MAGLVVTTTLFISAKRKGGGGKFSFGFSPLIFLTWTTGGSYSRGVRAVQRKVPVETSFRNDDVISYDSLHRYISHKSAKRTDQLKEIEKETQQRVLMSQYDVTMTSSVRYLDWQLANHVPLIGEGVVLDDVVVDLLRGLVVSAAEQNQTIAHHKLHKKEKHKVFFSFFFF